MTRSRDLANHASVGVSTVELGYLDGVTSPVQTQMGTLQSNIDLKAPTASPTFTGTATIPSGSSVIAPVISGNTSIEHLLETASVSATAATGTINYNLTIDKAVSYYTSAAAANWSINFRGNSGATINSILAVGKAVTIVLAVTQGATAYYQSTQGTNVGFMVDGTTTGVTVKWQGGSAPTSGNANSIDVYTYTVIKTAASTYTVFAARTKFA